MKFTQENIYGHLNEALCSTVHGVACHHSSMTIHVVTLWGNCKVIKLGTERTGGMNKEKRTNDINRYNEKINLGEKTI